MAIPAACSVRTAFDAASSGGDVEADSLRPAAAALRGMVMQRQGWAG